MSDPKGKHGGFRPGAGRKPKPAALSGDDDPLTFLRKVWKGEIDANSDQVRAATAALPYVAQKVGEGKKKDLEDAAKNVAASGKFSTPESPKRDPRTLN